MGAVSVPDVSVVVAVYNTMPYLTDCLQSVLRQTIGTDRLEVIAVDDGSTDGSGAELDRWANRHPGVVKVLHQPNSGGPAAPSNRALDVAAGRYVLFLGADDYLGHEALARLVRAADELDADVVLGRLVGVGGRNVNQAVYSGGNRDDITLADSALPWALSNTKLFRRSLIEKLGLRYPEDLRSGSDQPFTLRAIVAARRIAVRADYKYYFAVRRSDASNITYRTSLSGFVHDTQVIMDTAADVITDPVARDKVLRRHFTWEIAKLLGERFLAADRDEQSRVQDGVRKLADTYLTEEIRASLDVHRRIAISVAQQGSLDDLIAVAEHYHRRGLAPVVAEGDRLYAGLPGFRDPARGFPDAWYDASAAASGLLRQTGHADVRWTEAEDGRRLLRVGWHIPMPVEQPPNEPAVQVTAGEHPGRVAVSPASGGGADLRAEFDLHDLVAGESRRVHRLVRLAWTVRDKTYTEGVNRPDLDAAGRMVVRRGLRFYLVHLDRDEQRRLAVTISPLTPRTIAGRLARELRARRGR